MGRRWPRRAAIGAAVLVGLALVAASVVVPAALLVHADDRTVDRWAQVGQALQPVGVLFSGVAFIGIAVTLFLQGRELQNQREELTIAREEQRRTSEIALRQLHTDLIKMAIDDRELREVWPPIAPGTTESRKDHYCNLILNLQKVAYEAGTIELAELRGALAYLMTSRDMYLFWRRARSARSTVTAGDEAEDFFTAEVDRAFAAAHPPPAGRLRALIWDAVTDWLDERRPSSRR